MRGQCRDVGVGQAVVALDPTLPAIVAAQHAHPMARQVERGSGSGRRCCDCNRSQDRITRALRQFHAQPHAPPVSTSIDDALACLVENLAGRIEGEPDNGRRGIGLRTPLLRMQAGHLPKQGSGDRQPRPAEQKAPPAMG